MIQPKTYTNVGVLCSVCSLLLYCAFLAFAGEDGGDQRENGGDQEKIQGRWNVTELVRNGESAPEELVDAAGYVIDDGSLDPTINGEKREDSTVTFKLNDATNPKQIDLTEEDSGEIHLGIYELTDDRLKMFYYDSDETRPEAFQPEAEGLHNILIVLERTQSDEMNNE